MVKEFKVLRVSGTGRILEEDGRPFKWPVPSSTVLNQLSRHAWEIVGLVPAAHGDHFIYLRRDSRPSDQRPAERTAGDSGAPG